MLKILLADDHAVVRRGIRDILNDEYGQITFAEAKDFSEVLDSLEKQDWDLLILDINMPHGNILDVLATVVALRPAVPVLVLSMYPEEQYAVHVLKAGAAGYLTKESVTDELIAAVRKVLSGGKYVSPSLSEKLASGLLAGTETPLHETLSTREFSVMLMIASGKSVKEIAEEVCLSAKTVSTYRSRLLDKMKMKTTADIIRYAVEHRLIE